MAVAMHRWVLLVRFPEEAAALFPRSTKGIQMQVPVQTKPVFWGAVAGAIAMAFIGFTWGGWVTGGTAESNAAQRANTAVVAALAPVCVERFRQGADVGANLAALKKAESWAQGEFVEKGGWAASPGAKAPDQVTAVARACATLLAAA